MEERFYQRLLMHLLLLGRKKVACFTWCERVCHSPELIDLTTYNAVGMAPIGLHISSQSSTCIACFFSRSSLVWNCAREQYAICRRVVPTLGSDVRPTLIGHHHASV